jgi:hypothetical protein
VRGALGVLRMPNLFGGTTDDPTASPSATPSATAGASPTSEGATPTDLIGPGPAQPGELMLRFTQPCDVVPPILTPRVTFLHDGRVIWYRDDPADPFASGYLIRQLTSAGIDELRARITELGIFTEDAFYGIELRSGEQPRYVGGVCSNIYAWSENPGAEPVDVEAIMWLGDENEVVNEPAPERRALDSLARAVGEPEAWLADDAYWMTDPAVTYEPTDYVLLITLSDPRAATPGAPDVDDVWPFPESPDEFGEVRADAIPEQRCVAAAPDLVRGMADALATAGLEQFEGELNGANVTLPWAERGAAVDIYVSPRMPDGAPTCDVGQPPA